MRHAHLSSMLALLACFAAPNTTALFDDGQDTVHVFAICALLFIQIQGRHVFEPSSSDHWPAFQGANEAAVEQLETNKATLSRSRIMKAGVRHPAVQQSWLCAATAVHNATAVKITQCVHIIASPAVLLLNPACTVMSCLLHRTSAATWTAHAAQRTSHRTTRGCRMLHPLLATAGHDTSMAHRIHLCTSPNACTQFCTLSNFQSLQHELLHGVTQRAWRNSRCRPRRHQGAPHSPAPHPQALSHRFSQAETQNPTQYRTNIEVSASQSAYCCRPGRNQSTPHPPSPRDKAIPGHREAPGAAAGQQHRGLPQGTR